MILIYTMLATTTLYYLGSRATLTGFLHRRYPLGLARFMDCAMCSGAWYGFLIAAAALGLGYDYPGLEDRRHALVVCLLGSAMWTPLLAALVERAIGSLGTRQEIFDEMIERGLVEPEAPPEPDISSAAVMRAVEHIQRNVPPPCSKCKTKLLSPDGIFFACPRCDPSSFDVETGRPT